MLKKVKRYVELMKSSDESFDHYFIQYMKRVQDLNLDMEVRNMLRFSLLQLSQFDRQIETDYRKLVNEQYAKSSGY